MKRLTLGIVAACLFAGAGCDRRERESQVTDDDTRTSSARFHDNSATSQYNQQGSNIGTQPNHPGQGMAGMGEAAGRSDFSPAPGEVMKTLSGKIDEIDVADGEIEVRGEELRANPALLRGLQEGQQVSLTYNEVDGTNWVSEIQSQPSVQGSKTDLEFDIEDYNDDDLSPSMDR